MEQASYLKKTRALPGIARRASAKPRDACLPKLDTDVVPDLSVASSPAIQTSASTPTLTGKRNSIARSLRSLGLGSPISSPTASSTSVFATSDGESVSPLPRTLRKHRTVSIDYGRSQLGRRESSRSIFTTSAGSHETTSVSQSSTNSIDGRIQWHLQQVQGVFKIIIEQHFLRSKSAYVIVTNNYIIKVKGIAEVHALFPSLPPDMLPGGPTPASKAERPANPEVSQLIPIESLVSASRAESSRPYFGIELWWKSTYSLAAFGACQFFAEDPTMRDLMLDSVHAAVRKKDDAHFGVPRVAHEVEEKICEISRREEPEYPLLRPEMFPVGIRLADNAKWAENESFYFAIGVNLCYFIKAARPADNKGLIATYAKYGIMNLECANGCWAPREDRFELRFRKPLEAKPTYLHVSSRFSHHILQTLLKADEALRPCWPSSLRRTQVFRVDKLPHSGVDVDVATGTSTEFGGLHRTHKAFCAAFDCQPVAWEMRLDGGFGPELRVLPPRDARPSYEPLELMALLRAIRYNRFIGSISLRGVSLRCLWDKFDSSRPESVAYMNPDETIISSNLCKHVQKGSVLSQEIHALALCLPSLTQIDLTDTLGDLPLSPHKDPDLGILFPIINLLSVGLTACNRILVAGCRLGSGDVAALVSGLDQRNSVDDGLQFGAELKALDVSRCSLSSGDLTAIVESLMIQSRSLELLDISQNMGRIFPGTISRFIEAMADLRSLNTSDAVIGQDETNLLSYESLGGFRSIERINISGYKMTLDTEKALIAFLEIKAIDQRQKGGFSIASRGLERIQLDSCGIDGHRAARIISAASGLQGLHIHLNGNPIDQGVEDLASAIAFCSEGSFGLHLDMIEFNRVEGYVRLLQAITVSKRFIYVSLAGTAPPPLPSAVCTPAVSDALEQLFALNNSIRVLDLSGYAGKLDEGQLGRGFGRAFRGLSRNGTMRTLILRNQNLSTEVGDLGLGIQENRALRRLDIRGSEINLTALLFLRRSLKSNRTIVQLPFGREQQDRLLERAVHNVPDPARTVALSDLRLEVSKQAVGIQKIIARNRKEAEMVDDGDQVAGILLGAEPDHGLDIDEQDEDGLSFLQYSARPLRRQSRCVISSLTEPEVFTNPYRLSDLEEAIASAGGSMDVSPARHP
ncbi:hypothetical protein MCOR03_001757 [Pyricularia oryzae]|uniref:LRR-containing protein second PH domain-containing protein n=1 Tax=Pyricularia grisea TaxID=148305 RepID=A0ABQ8NVM9_PYRGI|nr:hypothetical protein MCOR26_008527 [Pyricularia oryzae]KAI6302801.1 hypothetical protein MCOR33_001889 [Pyricularia grisea]KAI6332480.1 hypothetical protein MCOR28_010847 [Pyricularia oryzae]KAI6339415.1 hypothetical protein MCOR30_002805 [Pyricularia oryzae]KAI6381528.1 hypothetical protein MCOR32_003429 [Pyricularia oryzae]